MTFELFRNLELSGFNDPSGSVAKLVNINSTCKIREIDKGSFRKIGLLAHFSSKKIIDLKGITFFERLLKFETNRCRSGVGIKPHDCSSIRRRQFAGLCLGLNGCYKDNRQ